METVKIADMNNLDVLVIAVVFFSFLIALVFASGYKVRLRLKK